MRAALGVALRSSVLRIDHLCCGVEARLVHELLDPMEDVMDVKISLSDRRVNVEHTPNLSPAAIVDVLNGKHLGASLQEKHIVEHVGSKFNARELLRVGINTFSLLLFATMCALQLFGKHQAAEVLGYACVCLSVALFHEAYLAILRRTPNVEVMMAIAMLGALVQGDPIEAANVGSLVTLMDQVKVFALEAVERKLRGSVVADPLTIDVPGGKKPLAELRIGDEYVLRVGDVVPADGTVIQGNAALDESRVTGEAMPQDKRKGDKVVSGSLVSMGFLKVRTDVLVDHSFTSRVGDAVRDARGTMSSTEAIVGHFATWYTPTVLVLAGLLGIFQGFNQFLVVIVAGCPCALLGAAPFVQGATLSLLAGRHRLLVKSTTALEDLARIRVVGLDKTGTLTTGRFELLRKEAVSSYPIETLHEWAAAVEEKDNHPIARSLVSSFKVSHATFGGCIGDFAAAGYSLPDASNFKRHGRDGVSATVAGHVVGVGNLNFVMADGGHSTGTGNKSEAAEAEEGLRAAQAALAEAVRTREEMGQGQVPERMRRSLQKKEDAAKAALEEANARVRHAHHAEQQQPKGKGKMPLEADGASESSPGGSTRALALADEWATSGSVLFVTVDSQVAAVLLMADSLKPEAAETVAAMRKLGVRPVLLTGDKMINAGRVAKAVGITEADTFASLLPEDKQRVLLNYSHEDGSVGEPTPAPTSATHQLEAGLLAKPKRGAVAVGFVGDGLNDCVALASAHVGVVLQEVGSQATVDAASAVLQANLGELPAAIVIARRANLLVMVNLFLALAMNVAVVATAATIGMPLWVSVLADSGGLLVVLANSLWPLMWRVRPVSA